MQLSQIDEFANQLNWNCRETILEKGNAILSHLSSNRLLLKELVENLNHDDALFSLCERYDFFDKLILYIDPSGRFKIRLSIFSEFVSNRPHFHRWSYVAKILKGSYLHSIFGNEVDFEKTPIELLEPTHLCEISPQSPYFLHHSIVHAVKAKPRTVSLLLQGPPQKDRFLVIDRKIKRKWWEYGSEQETSDEKHRKQISKSRLKELIQILCEEEII